MRQFCPSSKIRQFEKMGNPQNQPRVCVLLTEHPNLETFSFFKLGHCEIQLRPLRAVAKSMRLLGPISREPAIRAKKLFQFLNEIGARALGIHLGRVLVMAESSADKWEYETKVAKRFGFEQQLELPIPMPTSAMGQEAAN
jgi:hypothetical protein